VNLYLREDHMPQTFKNKVHRKISSSDKGKVSDHFRILSSEALSDL
jgi:hypothetical protein